MILCCRRTPISTSVCESLLIPFNSFGCSVVAIGVVVDGYCICFVDVLRYGFRH